MAQVSVLEFRNNLAEVLNRVSYQGERVQIERHGKPVAVMVSVEDAALLEAMEDRADVKAAKRALALMKRKGQKPIPWSKVKAELGL